MTVSTFKPGLICVSETWLTSQIIDSHLLIDEYCLFRDDRENKKGGGVCAWIHNSFSPVVLTPFYEKPKCIECLMFSLSSCNILCIVLYIPPALLAADHGSIETFLSSQLDRWLLSNPNQLLLVTGDFNDFPTAFFTENFNFVNKVIDPTRQRSLLDHIWMDDGLSELYEEHATVGPPLASSDHNCVILTPTSLSSPNQNKRIIPVWDFRRSHIINFTNCLATHDFDELDYEEDVDTMCEHFYELFYIAMDEIPCNYVMISDTDKPWMNPLLKLLINKRWEAYRNRKWHLFLHYKHKIKCEIIKAKKAWAEKNCGSSKGLWNVVNQMRNRTKRDNFGDLQKEFGGIDNLLNALSHEFISNFNHHADDVLKPFSPGSFDITISEQEVFHVLSHLKANKSAGADNIPPRLLKEGAAWLCVPLAKIFNRSIKEMTFPMKFKLGKVCPVPKKSRPTKKDFRPISVLSSFSKVFEILVLNKIKKRF